MSKCARCGVEIQEGATICWVCQRRQIYQDDSWESRSKSVISRSAIGSLFLAILILLALVLTGYVLMEWKARIAGLFAFFSSLFIGWLGTRGRYIMPTRKQYLVTMFISLIPVVGTAYCLFFTGRYFTEHRVLRIIAYLYLVSSAALLLFWMIYQGKYDLGKQLGFFKRSVSPTPTIQSIVTKTPIRTPSAIIHTSPTSSPTSVLATIENPALAGCLHWSSVTVDIVGQNVCVYGEYMSISQKQDQSYVLTFSDEPGTFQVWSYPRPFEPYLPENGDRCVVIRGWLKTSGVRPIIILGTLGKMEPCP
jgi:hypothetical protein